jgi:arginine/lysine/ornithine decarboxylase
LLVPGETVTQEVLDYIDTMNRLGATIDGFNTANNTMSIVKT